MCGRIDFSWDMPDPAALRLKLILTERFPQMPLPLGEACPGTRLPVLVPGTGKAEITLMDWGIPLSSGKLLINARAETAAEKPMFRDALASRRAALPVSGFYEWTHDGARQKFRFHLPDSSLLYLAVLFDSHDRFVILTEAANSSMIDVHGRMPVILPPRTLRGWLSNPAKSREILSFGDPPLVREAI